MDKNNQMIPRDVLTRYCARILAGAGASRADADLVADSMVYADARGVASHGVIRLEAYVRRMESGVMNCAASMPIVRHAPASAVLDAQNGFGQVAGVKAMDLAIAKAKAVGVGLVCVRNSNHFGVSAYYAARATAANMTAIVLTNAGPAMAPHNGTAPLMGTNPFAAAVPSATGEAWMLDMATSEVARGKIRRAAKDGTKIPAGWAVDKDGQPTTDAGAALGGMLCPMGGPKGAGLALMIDLFTGVLSGSCLTGDVLPVTDLSGPARTGHFFLAIDPAFFVGTERFLADVAAVGERVRGQKPADGGRVFLPGEIESENEKRMREQGIALNADRVASLEALGARYGAGARITTEVL